MLKKSFCGNNFHETALRCMPSLITPCACATNLKSIITEEHMERFSIDSAVRGFHVYKDIRNPEIGEVLICKQEFKNLHDPYAVSAVHEDNIMVGHVPRTISALCYFFLRRNGMILCQVTGR